MIDIRWSPATIYRELKACLGVHLPQYIEARVAADALLDPSDRLLQKLDFPTPKFFAGTTEDMARDKSTPAMFIDLTGQQWFDVDASQLQDVETRLVVTLMVGERDVNASSADEFLIAMSVYSDAVCWVIRSQFPYWRCDMTGVITATPTYIPFSPPIQPQGSPYWLRTIAVEAAITHRTKIERSLP